MADFHIRIRVSRRQVRWGAAGLLLSFSAAELATERFSLSTYYPAPSGIYTRLVSAQDAYLARDGGVVVVGTISPAPGGKLDVAGAANFGGDLAAAGAVSGGGLSVSGDVTAAGKVAATGDITSRGASVIADYGCSGQITCSRSGNNTLVLNACVSNGSCSGCAPACGKSCQGTDNCGNPCAIQGPACCVPSGCQVNPPCGQQVCGSDNCGNACCKTGPPCPTYTCGECSVNCGSFNTYMAGVCSSVIKDFHAPPGHCMNPPCDYSAFCLSQTCTAPTSTYCSYCYTTGQTPCCTATNIPK